MGSVIGVDVGQKRDPTAISVCTRELREGKEHHTARFLQRLPLGTPYPAVGERLKEIVAGAQKMPGGVSAVFVDATGVGLPVVDALSVAGVRVIGCYFTHGDKRTEKTDDSGKVVEVVIGKGWLVSKLQVLLQHGRVHLPDTPEALRLAKELRDYELKISENGNDTWGAFKTGAHDDLVTALGLSVQPPPRSLGGWLVVDRVGPRRLTPQRRGY